MKNFGTPLALLEESLAPDLVGNSLRFRGGQYLSRTDYEWATSWTISCWVKVGNINQDTAIFGACLPNGASTSNMVMRYQTSHAGGNPSPCFVSYVYDLNDTAGATYPGAIRDPNGWYHIVVSKAAGEHQKLWVNNIPNVTYAPNWYDLVGTNVKFNIGGDGLNPGTYFFAFDGYMADFHCVSGSVVAPTEFGEYDSNNVWIPKIYAGTYGAQGFHLTFDPTQDADPAVGIGIDSSGNNNHFTSNGGFETSDITSNFFDCMVDSPTRNFSTLNALAPTNYPTIRQVGNLLYAHNTATWWTDGYSTIPMPKSGKVYYEILPETTSGGSNFYQIGLVPDIYAVNGQGAVMSANYPNSCLIENNGQGLYIGSTRVGDSAVTLTFQQTIGVAVDMDAGTVTFYADGNLVGSITLPTDVTGWISSTSLYKSTSVSGQSIYAWHNFGQQPTQYGPPAGYNWLNTANLPAAPIPNGRDHFKAITAAGSVIKDQAQDAPTGFAKGLWWIKGRATTEDHQFLDSLRGGELTWYCPAVSNEGPFSRPSGDSVAWCWKAGDSSVTNNDGTVQSEVSANTEGGFSMVTYTGSGTGTNTVGHGLTKPPEVILFKNRTPVNGPNTAINSPIMVHTGLGNWEVILYLNSIAAQSAPGGISNGNGTAPTEQVFAVGSNALVNQSGSPFIAYCWHSVPGYSAFGSVVAQNYPFVYTGFRPAFVLLKSTAIQGNWVILDSTRELSNPCVLPLFPNWDGPETATGLNIDFLSNGFKLNGASAAAFIYMAFAENPFGGENVSPSNAR